MDDDNYGKISGRPQQYRNDDPTDNMAGSESFKFKSRLTNAGIANTEIEVPLK